MTYRPKQSPSASTVLGTMLFAVWFAVALEAATIFGAPTLSLIRVADWSKTRLLLFFLLGLAIAAAYIKFGGKQAVAHRKHQIAQFCRHNGKRTLARLGIAASIAVTSAAATAALTSFTDGRIPLVSAIVAASIAVAVLFRDSIVEKAERGFLVICLGMGLVMSVSVPMSSGICWDDQIHYNYALALSYIVDAEYTPADQDMVMRDTLGEVVALYTPSSSHYPVVSLHADAVTAVNQTMDTLADGGALRLDGTTILPGDAGYLKTSSIGYAPNAIGLWLGRFLHLPFTGIVFLGKLFGLLFYALTFFFAIRTLDDGKLTVTAIGLLPTSVYMATNYAYDPWIISLTALSFCQFAKQLQNPQLNMDLRSSLSITLPFLLAIMVKAVYLPLALAFLFMPREKFPTKASRRQYLLCLLGTFAIPIAAVLAPIAVNLLLGTSGSGASLTDVRGGSNVDAPEQTRYLLSHPIDALSTFASYTLWILSPENYLDGGLLNFPYIFGGNADHIKPGPLALPEPVSPLFSDGGLLAKRILALLWLVGFLVLSFSDHKRACGNHPRPTPSIGISTLLGSILSYALICLSMYITFTAVGSSFIVGVQYRYLFPLLVPLLLLCCNRYTKFSLGTAPYKRVAFTYLGALSILTVGLIFFSVY